MTRAVLLVLSFVALACSDGGSTSPGSGGATGSGGGTATGTENCDPSAVRCRAAPPSCGAGQVPRVEGDCWGGCIDDQQCVSFSVGTGACSLCPDGFVCVQTINGIGETTTRCVPVPGSCTSNRTCDCVNGALGCTRCEMEGSRFRVDCPSGPVP